MFFRAYVCLQMDGLCKNIKIKTRTSIWSTRFLIIGLLFIWNVGYWYKLDIYGMAATVAQRGAWCLGYHACGVYTLRTIICLLCLCERPFVHFTDMNINCNWLMWALCVGMRATYVYTQCVSDWNATITATLPDTRMLNAVYYGCYGNVPANYV